VSTAWVSEEYQQCERGFERAGVGELEAALVFPVGGAGDQLEAPDRAIPSEELFLAQVVEVCFIFLVEVLGGEIADEQSGQVDLHEAHFAGQPGQLFPAQLLRDWLAAALCVRKHLPPDCPIEPSKEE